MIDEFFIFSYFFKLAKKVATAKTKQPFLKFLFRTIIKAETLYEKNTKHSKSNTQYFGN
jgi:hypothetical protein